MTTRESASHDSRRLVLMRHAKSDWGHSSLADHDRPLNRRGRRDAPKMARWLAEAGAIPDIVFCSSAARTRETVSLMTPEWDDTAEVSYCEKLYLATPETILKTATSDRCDARVLMVVAHNPGIAQLVCLLADQAIEMPTAAIAIFEVSVTDWSELRSSSPTKLIQFMRPKAL